jgi:capsular exopolysaccharide synthesis family protein
VILLTSPSPAEGKTQSTLNLAIALAQDGHNVLVIDADLRKGTCHSRLGITNHRGLSNVLTGKLALEEAVRSTSISGLSLLSRGIRAPNPTDLLGSPKMRQILSKLRESFTFILIDSPPAIVVSDAAVLSVLCDGVLLVFHGQKTTKASARQAMERLDSVRAPFLGAILNSVDLRNPEYAYFRYYYGSDYASAGAPENGAASHVAALTEELREIEARLQEIGPETVPEIGPGIVPQEFFDHMTSNLTEAAGPMAPLIVRDHIALLGESRTTFPKQRVKELLELVSREIANERIRDDFCRQMQEDLMAR